MDLTDGDLLAEFLQSSDEKSFMEIIRRHGGLVMGVARRVLQNEHDAEDVFQATFIILAREVGSIKGDRSLSSWLYKVAFNLSLRHRRKNAARRSRESAVVGMHSLEYASGTVVDGWREISPVLDEELDRMSEKLRAPLICCYIEGMKREEAADYLGVSLATLGRRLERGRDYLKARLMRRGIAVGAAVMVAAIGGNAKAAVAKSLVTATAKESVLSVSGLGSGGSIGIKVATLVKEGAGMIFWAKVKAAAFVLFATATVTASGAYVGNELLNNSFGGDQKKVVLEFGDRDNTAPVYPYSPYDGDKRYAMEKGHDTPKRYQNLIATQKRYGYKPYKKLWRNGHWQSERLVVHDAVTGAKIVRLTDDYGSDYLDYHKGAWSANGKYILWRRRPGMWEPSTDTNGPTCVNSDGTNIRPVFRDAPGSRLVRKYQCDRNTPDVAYSMVRDRTLCAFSLSTGKYLRTLGTPGGAWHLKSSIDGKYLLSYVKKDTGRFLWVIPVDAKDEKDGNARTHWVSLGKSIHDSYYIHPTEPYVMFWYEGDYRQEGFRQKRFDNTDEQATGIKFDWNHGDFGLKGKCVHESGKVYSYNGIKWSESRSAYCKKDGEEYYDIPHNYNGYSSYMPKDGDWVVGSRIVYAPYISELQMHGVDPVDNDRVNRFRICMIGIRRGGALDAVDGSPDGTKFVFNSDMLDANQIWYVVARNPEPPVDVKLENGRLSWSPAKHSKETKGYVVYRSETSGGPYTQISDIVNETEFSVGQKGYYVVSSIEHSGLEGNYSAEVTGDWMDGTVRVFAEAESGDYNTVIWKCFNYSASNLYYVWHRKKGETGTVNVKVNIPRTGGYTLWVRVKGGGKWDVSGQEIDASSDDWRWVKAAGKLNLNKGEVAVKLTSGDYGAAIDSIWLSLDGDFKPTGRGREDVVPPAVVKGLQAVADGCFSAKLNWTSNVEKDIAHYNIYISEDENFKCFRETLIASPVDTQYLDWKLEPGKTYYYKITAVDRRDNEGLPSGPVKVATAGQDYVKFVADIKPAADSFVINDSVATFNAKADGKYCIWLLLEGRANGYINLKIGKHKLTWSPRHSDKVSKEAWMSYGQFGVVDLKAGDYGISVDAKNIKIKKILLTNNLSWKPEGYTLTGCVW